MLDRHIASGTREIFESNFLRIEILEGNFCDFDNTLTWMLNPG